jgi:hypothetical protein
VSLQKRLPLRVSGKGKPQLGFSHFFQGRLSVISRELKVEAANLTAKYLRRVTELLPLHRELKDEVHQACRVSAEGYRATPVR